jgi:hypothetical protein
MGAKPLIRGHLSGHFVRIALAALALILSACDPAAGYKFTPRPAPAPPIEVPAETPGSWIEPPETPALSPAGRALIYEFEVGGQRGYNPRPEAPDARSSGVTFGIGYDAHQNAPIVIVGDWRALGAQAQRLADTHPYYGRSAQTHLTEVRDILVAWQIASDVFDRIDTGREFSAARRAYGAAFELLRPNAQAALISIGFNRGYSFVGANRTEMREVRNLTPARDYKGMADQIRLSERCWRGTEIYNGMKRRRLAEAKLMETP